MFKNSWFCVSTRGYLSCTRRTLAARSAYDVTFAARPFTAGRTGAAADCFEMRLYYLYDGNGAMTHP